MKRCGKCGKLPEIIKNEQGEKALGCTGCGEKIYLERGEGNVTRAIKIWDKMQEGKENEKMREMREDTETVER